MVEEEMAEEVDKKVHVEMDGCDGCSAGSCGGSCRLQIRFSRLRM